MQWSILHLVWPVSCDSRFSKFFSALLEGTRVHEMGEFYQGPKLVEEATVHKDSLKSVFAINRKIVNTAIGRDVEEALNRYPVPILATHIHQRVSFAESALGGLIVSETDPKSMAAQEIRTLTEE